MAAWARGSTNWWSPHPVELDPMYARYRSRLSRANLARYLATQPALDARVFAGGAGACLSFRNTNIGTYPMHAGYTPESQECRSCLLQDTAHALKWNGFSGVLVYWLACFAAAGWPIARSVPGGRRRAFGLVGLALIGCTVVQYTTAVYGEGDEVTKHLSPALFAAALAPVWLVAGAFQQRRARPVVVAPRRASSLLWRTTASLR
ncbi:hypothetical protein KGA66_05930 [Actinocrinis puniceicyclus]|uniref:Uncharacterized protein n=1 Tax=Actinocrinis puniceicyclus TaxID=977794 RepID=A0A8J7WLZ5_9ACTN|nr:hypothetical protein [Actinocrinis puniceicyclus]MBS2962577.1 hypothetical protein [Actinocrinis puniceicyclus]